MQIVAAQRHRLHRAANFARAHLSDALNLDTLAETAHLSKFHFTRAFHAQFRETPGLYLARIRLELAARKLMQTESLSITHIAMDCGFSGSATFSRAFRGRFGCAPRTFKGYNQWCQDAVTAPKLTGREIHRPGMTIGLDDRATLRVRIERRPEYHVAYIRHLGPYGDINNTITNTFTELQRWASERGLLRRDTTFIGLCPDNCSITPARHCTYDACMVLDGELPEDDIVSIQIIPQHTCAVLYVECKSIQLNRYWTWLTSVWLPRSGKTLSFVPAFEFFPAYGHRPVIARFGAELCLPIVD